MRYRIAIAAVLLPLLATACTVEDPSASGQHHRHHTQAAKKKPQKPKPSQTKTKAQPRPLAATKPTKKPAPVYYANCDEVRAAGAAPIRRGDPGYGSWLDRDGDGIGCED